MTLYVPERKVWTRQPQLPIVRPEYRDGLQISAPLAGDLTNNILPTGVSLTNSGATPTGFVDAQGFSCNGTSNYLSFGDAFYSDTLTYLITWTPTDAGDANTRTILIKRNSSAGTDAGAPEIWLYYTSTYIAFGAWNSSGTIICNPAIAISVISGKPYHICVVHRGAGKVTSLWVNGTEVTATASATAVRNTTNHLQIASRAANNDNRWGKGIFTNFHAWNIAREDGLALSQNPWQIFAPRRQWFAIGSTGNTLRVPFKTSAGADDNIWLTTDNTLRFNNAAGYYDPISAITV